MGKTAKRVNAILSEWKVWLFFLLCGAVLGAFLYARIYPMFAHQQEQSQHTVQTLSPSVVFSRVREEGELVSTSSRTPQTWTRAAAFSTRQGRTPRAS